MIDLIGELRRIMNKDVNETFATATDSLEALRDWLAAGGAGSPGLVYYGVVTNVVNPTTFDAALLVGHGDAYFESYWIFVVRDAAGGGNLPQREARPVLTYVSATGRFTHAPFSAALAAGDEILLMHRILAIFVSAVGVADAGSDADTIVDAERVEANDFWNGCSVLMGTGQNGGLVRPIVDFDAATDSIEIRPALPFPVAAGNIYVILANYHDLVPAADGALNDRPSDVTGSKASTPIYTPTNTADIIRYLKGILNTVNMGSRPLVNLYEGWQDEAGIDPLVWTVTNPATGAAWARGAVGENLMAFSSPNANENARIRSNQRWVADPTLYGVNKILRRFVLEFEAHFVGFANFDNVNFLLGLTTAVGNTRATPNIIGFALVGAGNALQTLTDAGGAETVNTGFGENLLLTNKFRIDISLNSAVFYLNEALIATHVVNLPDAPFYLNFYAPTGGGGPATIRLGIIRAWTEDIPR